MSHLFLRYSKNIWKKPNQKGMFLGRWGTIIDDKDINHTKRNKSIEFNIDNANHDHCGSELCSKQEVKKEEKKLQFFFDDEYPYIIRFTI